VENKKAAGSERSAPWILKKPLTSDHYAAYIYISSIASPQNLSRAPHAPKIKDWLGNKKGGYIGLLPQSAFRLSTIDRKCKDRHRPNPETKDLLFSSSALFDQFLSFSSSSLSFFLFFPFPSLPPPSLFLTFIKVIT
jgi:hypothetical protein